jgi:transcriptional regulator of arginine metabolism
VDKHDRKVGSQAELVSELTRRGIECTQASVSRDLAGLGVLKVGGAYRTPQLGGAEAGLVGRLTVDACGDNLIVLHTGPGAAQVAANQIDKARIAGVVGTVAGDDTIFIAVRGKDDQTKVIRRLIALFKGE